ncbi:MAG: hypothetical protein AAF770_00010 [Bacteroidota bacterium]
MTSPFKLLHYWLLLAGLFLSSIHSTKVTIPQEQSSRIHPKQIGLAHATKTKKTIIATVLITTVTTVITYFAYHLSKGKIQQKEEDHLSKKGNHNPNKLLENNQEGKAKQTETTNQATESENSMISQTKREDLLKQLKEKAGSKDGKPLISVHGLPKKRDTPIWLFQNGCFRIPHTSHFKGILTTYRLLAKAGYTQVIIKIAPSHQMWINHKCQRDQHRQKEKGMSYLVCPDHNTRAQLITSLLDNLQKVGTITTQERNKIEVDGKLEKENSDDWTRIVDKLRRDHPKVKVIYCCGEDLLQYTNSVIIQDQIAFKRNVASGLSSTAIITGKGNYRQALKESLPDYYVMLQATFPDLKL